MVDYRKLIDALKRQRDEIDAAIGALAQLGGSAGLARGRTSAGIGARSADGASPARGRRRRMSAATRRKMAEARKRWWAARKEAGA